MNCLDSSFSGLKYCIIYEFVGQMLNYIQLAWKLTCLLKLYRTCNPMVGFSKYEFNNKLLDSVAFFWVMSGVIRTQSYIS